MTATRTRTQPAQEQAAAEDAEEPLACWLVEFHSGRVAWLAEPGLRPALDERAYGWWTFRRHGLTDPEQGVIVASYPAVHVAAVRRLTANFLPMEPLPEEPDEGDAGDEDGQP